MNCIDVFNGDADGICALQQLRLHRPQPEARLVTGVKRDILLLARLKEMSASRVTVLDISLDPNREALERLLQQQNFVFYADHHYSGALPESAFLEAHIDPSPNLCTSLIVDRLLSGKFRAWAIAGAYGDDLDEVAGAHAKAMGLRAEAIEQLREIGVLLNYNGYGFSLDDLLVPPADAFREVQRYPDPLVFYRDSPMLRKLRAGYDRDRAHAAQLQPFRIVPAGRVFWLPEAAWSRRVVGVFTNRMAHEQPDLAHAVLTPNPDGSLRVSVRAPLTARKGADTLCRQFATGGGRAAAAGINSLPAQESEFFFSAFSRHFSR